MAFAGDILNARTATNPDFYAVEMSRKHSGWFVESTADVGSHQSL